MQHDTALGVNRQVASCIPTNDGLDEKAANLLTTLGLLVLKRRKPKESDAAVLKRHNLEAPTTAPVLWRTIVTRLDQLYLATEDLLKPCKTVIAQLVAGLGVSEHAYELSFAGLKDPVRIHEKAMDDYAHDFDDWEEVGVIPEACVLDVIRCRLIIAEGSKMLAVQKQLVAGCELYVNGQTVRVELVRLKGKFARLDPTHFRNNLNNLLLTFGERS
eukprot:568550-Prymnesium_polylepis.1